MKSVPAEAGVTESTRERDRVGDLGVAPVEGRVEAGHVKGIGIPRAGGRKSGQARRLVERVERKKRVELAGDRVVDEDRSREPRPAMDDAMADGEWLLARRGRCEAFVEKRERPSRVRSFQLPAREDRQLLSAARGTPRTSAWTTRRSGRGAIRCMGKRAVGRRGRPAPLPGFSTRRSDSAMGHRAAARPYTPRTERMSISPGDRLGPYEVLLLLGAGGMGEVYRARDTKLGRDVAIKVLPEELFEDEERRTRFEREARTLASLNHPGIATIYSFEEIPCRRRRHLLVMELVEGETLRAAARRGRSPGAKGRGPRRADRARPRGRARERNRPPGLQAGERHPHEGRAREDPRLRPRQAAGDRGGRGHEVADAREGHGPRNAPRDRRVHGARAGERACRPTRGRTSSRSGASSSRC